MADTTLDGNLDVSIACVTRRRIYRVIVTVLLVVVVTGLGYQ